MLAVLLLFALVNGLLVYSMIKTSDSENLIQFNEILWENEKNSIDTRLSFAHSAIYPYVVLSDIYPDSTDFYKNTVLVFLRETNWSIDKKHYAYYSIFDAKTGNSIMFRDTLGNILPHDKNVLEIEDINGKKFAKEIMEKAYTNDDSYTAFTYSKQCISCSPTERMAKGIYIEDWNWVIFTGNYTDKLTSASDRFSEKFKDSRLTLMGNLLGIMLISFLIGLFMVFRQMNSFVIPLRSLSNYIHRLANEGIRFEGFSIGVKLQAELKNLVEDLNSMIHNVGALIDNVRISADRVSDLSGACADMLDIVDYDAKLVGQRTAEMSDSSKDVIENVNSMAVGIEEININLDGLKRLASHVAENATDIKSSFSQISEAMKELNEKSRSVQNSTMSVDSLELKNSIISMVDRIAEINSSLQYINSSIKRVSSDINESYRKVDEVGVATDTMNEHAKQVKTRMGEFSLKSKRVEEAHSAIEHTLIDAKDSMKSLNDLSANLRKVVDDLVRLDDKPKIKTV
jgi:methyl-accepting chemotaxis protein